MTQGQCQLPSHKCVQFVWRKAKAVNRSSGLAALIHKELGSVVQFLTTPPESYGITGRVGMEKVKMAQISVACFPYISFRRAQQQEISIALFNSPRNG